MSDIPNPTMKQVAYIRRHINKTPFHVMRQQLRVSVGTMYEWVKNIYQPEKQVVMNQEGNEVHAHYLVTIDQFNYIVAFTVPVEFTSIQYCAHRIGFDYEVSKLGYWEYNHLRSSVPCINIKTDANYVSNFWETIKLWHE